MISSTGTQIYLGQNGHMLGLPTTASNGKNYMNFTSARHQSSGNSVKEKIKEKLTARVLPMARNTEVRIQKRNPELVKADFSQAVDHRVIYPAGFGLGWNTFDPSRVVVKKEVTFPEPCKYGYHAQTTISSKRRTKEESPAKRLKLSKPKLVEG